jgi:hypothetical protein
LIDLDDPFTATITGDFKTIECTAECYCKFSKVWNWFTINPNGAMDDGSLNWLY